MASSVSSDKKTLLSSEGCSSLATPSLQMQEADDTTAATDNNNSSKTGQKRERNSIAVVPSANQRTQSPHHQMYFKRGSLTINKMPQQFTYNEPKFDEPALVEDYDEEEASKEDAVTENGSVSDCLDDTAELNDGRPSSSSTKSARKISWRPWIHKTCCFGLIRLRCTWIFHPQGPLSYAWLMIVSVAVLHNLIHIPLRFAFCGWNMNLGLASSKEDIMKHYSNISSALTAIPAMFSPADLAFWMVPDYLCDLIYVIDIFKSMRTGFFADGFMNAHPPAILQHYLSSAAFYADISSLLPLDLLYLSFGLNSLLRVPRIIKMYRCFQFVSWTERHTAWPNLVRSGKMFIYVLIICHWNAAFCKLCLLGYQKIWFDKDTLDDTLTFDVHKVTSGKFLESAVDIKYYWAWLYVSVSTLCTLGLSGGSGLDYNEPPHIFAFLTFQMMLGLVLFAVTIGEILLIVDSLGAGRREFQVHLDAVKNFMGKRDIPRPVCSRVIRWFDYIWESRRGFDEDRRHLMVLPECIQADISLHAYLHTLKQVEFFRNTESGFLRELVLKLKPALFIPGEFVCTKGEIGRQMFIVEVGLLEVYPTKHTNVKPVAHLRRGQYFGELSILNMGKAGNRRTATIRSVGYSHLLSLSKDDLLSVLQDFPKQRARLEWFAAKRLERFRQESRESVTQMVINENDDRESLESSSNKETEAIIVNRPSCEPGIESVGDDENDYEPPVVTVKAADFSFHSDLELGDIWMPAEGDAIILEDGYSSQLELSPPEHAALSSSAGRRLSLGTVFAKNYRKQPHFRKANNYISQVSNPIYGTSSPLLRSARSMDVIDGLESAL